MLSKLVVLTLGTKPFCDAAARKGGDDDAKDCGGTAVGRHGKEITL